MRNLRLLFLPPLITITMAALDCLRSSPTSQTPKIPYISAILPGKITIQSK